MLAAASVTAYAFQMARSSVQFRVSSQVTRVGCRCRSPGGDEGLSNCETAWARRWYVKGPCNRESLAYGVELYPTKTRVLQVVVPSTFQCQR
jgi:hypothetical protein